MRRYIRMRFGLVHFKKSQVAGRSNKANTRAQGAINSVMVKIRRAAERYNAARDALLRLQPEGGPWSRRLRALDMAHDLRNSAGVDIEDDELTDQSADARRARALGEGYKDVPWIWLSVEHDRRDVIREDEATDEEVVEGTSIYTFTSFRSPYLCVPVFHQACARHIARLVHDTYDGRRRSCSSARKCGGFARSCYGRNSGGWI